MVAMTKKEAELAKKKAAVAAAPTGGKAGTPAEKAQELIASARPLARQAHAAFLEHAPKATAAYEQHQEKLPTVELIVALALLFFGVHFSLCILAYRAFQLTGADRIKQAYADLKASYTASMSTLRKDPELVALIDQNGDNEISLTELAQGVVKAVVADGDEELKQQKVLQATLKCIEPEKVVGGLVGIWAGLCGTLAVLWSSSLRGVVVGVQFQAAITSFARTRVFTNVAEQYPAYSQWLEFAFKGLGLLVGVFAASVLSSISLAVTSALEGSRVVSQRLIAVAQTKGWMDDAKVAEHGGNVVLGVAGLGVFAQLLVFDCVPWYISLPFMPGLVVESMLGWIL